MKTAIVTALLATFLVSITIQKPVVKFQNDKFEQDDPMMKDYEALQRHYDKTLNIATRNIEEVQTLIKIQMQEKKELKQEHDQLIYNYQLQVNY